MRALLDARLLHPRTPKAIPNETRASGQSMTSPNHSVWRHGDSWRSTLNTPSVNITSNGSPRGGRIQYNSGGFANPTYGRAGQPGYQRSGSRETCKLPDAIETVQGFTGDTLARNQHEATMSHIRLNPSVIRLHPAINLLRPRAMRRV